MTATPAVKSAKREVADYLRAQIELAVGGSVHLPQLVAETLAHFGRDSSFVKRYWLEAASTAIYEQARLIVAATRDVSIEPEHEGEGEQPRSRSVFARWTEHAGDAHFKLMRMTRPQLEQAIAERSARVETEQKTIAFLSEIARYLEPGETVRDHWTDVQLQTLARTHGVGL